jgi:pyruvate/2-oxoglutarate dehydrogenase complex dihydrolipoamide dehydrogenase (E3) component
MKVDVIIVGSGQAGMPLATRFASANKRVLLAERSRLGGTCVNYGCTPTKTMVASARAAHVARTAGRLGVRTGGVSVDFAAVVDRKDAIVRRWQSGVEKRLANAGERVQVVRGHARLTGPREIEVNGERHQGDIVILDVGGRPFVPAIDGLDPAKALDNHRLMDLRELPSHLAVLGGGYIGCEFGQMFRRFGSAVTIVDSHEHLLHREDPDTSVALEGVLREEGIALRLPAKVVEVRHDSNGVVLRLHDGSEIAASHLLIATGRRPNTDDLGCDATGVRLDAHGFIEVDDGYRTTAEGIYAVGDATGGPAFTHSAWDDHRILFERLQGHASRGRSDRLVPFVVFTDPQVAGVGMSEGELRSRGIAYEVATMPFGEIARAIEIDERAGTMKILIDPATERVLGCRLVGADAGELIHIFAALMQANASVRAIVDAEAAHPTFAEGVQSLVMRLPRFAL